MMPMIAPIKPMMTDSPRNMVSTVLLFMPNALSMPISRVRSIKDTIMMFMMPMPATSSEMAAMPPRNSWIVLKTLVSKLRTAVDEVTVTWLLKCSVMSFGDVGDCCVVAVV